MAAACALTFSIFPDASRVYVIFFINPPPTIVSFSGNGVSFASVAAEKEEEEAENKKGNTRKMCAIRLEK